MSQTSSMPEAIPSRSTAARPSGRDLRRTRRELRLLFTSAGAAMAFDAAVFLLLALLAAGVAIYWRWPWPGEAWLVLVAAVVFALFWAGLSQPDWRRYRKLHRRWIDQPDLPPTPWRVSTLTNRPPAPPPPVRSSYRPARGAASMHSRWVWRASR